MDRHYSRQSPYQPSAGQVYLDYLHLNGQDNSIDERVRAHELSVRPLSLSELEGHHKRLASLQRYANDHLELVRATENGPFTALRQRKIPPTKTNHGKNCTQTQQSSGIQHTSARTRSRPLDIPSQNYREQQIPGPRRDQRGYTEFEISDHERRLARMGLVGQKCYGKGATPHTTPALPEPVRTSRSLRICVPEEKPTQQMQERAKAQVQYSETPACCPLVQEQNNNALLKTRAREEAGQRIFAQKCEQEMVQKVQLPAAKPGTLYPGPSRISGTLPPLHASMAKTLLYEIENSVYLKSKLASQEAYLKYKEEERDLEEKRKGASSVPGSVPVATRTESVKRLLANVNKPLEQEVEAVGDEGAETRGVPDEALRVQSRQSHRRRSPRLHPTAAIMADRSAPHTETIQREPSPSSESSNVRTAAEAIDETNGELLGSPKAESGQENSQPVNLKPLSIKQYGTKVVVHLARVSLATSGNRSFEVSTQGVFPLPVPQPEQKDMSSELRVAPNAIDALKLVLVVDNAEPQGAPESVNDVVENAIQSGWERIDDSLGDDEWSVVEQDSVDDVSTRSPSSSDTEWAFDVVSEGRSDS